MTTDAEGYKAVKYNQLPFYMLQAIKDLKAENDALKQQMKAQDLKAENDALKRQLQAQDQRLRRLEEIVGKESAKSRHATELR